MTAAVAALRAALEDIEAFAADREAQPDLSEVANRAHEAIAAKGGAT